jgi:hypothetical protein
MPSRYGGLIIDGDFNGAEFGQMPHISTTDPSHGTVRWSGDCFGQDQQVLMQLPVSLDARSVYSLGRFERAARAKTPAGTSLCSALSDQGARPLPVGSDDAGWQLFRIERAPPSVRATGS